MLEEDLGIAKTIVSEILIQDFGISCVVVKFVPRLLTEDQNDCRVQVAQVINIDELRPTAMIQRQMPNLPLEDNWRTTS